jgi:hypothetical protein
LERGQGSFEAEKEGFVNEIRAVFIGVAETKKEGRLKMLMRRPSGGGPKQAQVRRMMGSPCTATGDKRAWEGEGFEVQRPCHQCGCVSESHGLLPLDKWELAGV